MADPTDINELFSQGQQGAKEASETSKGPYETLVSLKDRGYLPEMVAGTTAATVGGFTIKNYLKNLSAVKDAIKAEEEAVRKLRVPATKGGRQPFSKEGFTLSGARDVKADMPKKGGAVPYTRLSNVRAIGGPEGTGLGVLKGKEAGTAARMTAEQMVKYLRGQSNFGVTATTPRIEIKGFQEGTPTRQTVIVRPSDVTAGKLPTVKVPAGELPAPEANIIPRTLGRLRGLFSKAKAGTQVMSGAFGAIPMVTDELMRQSSDYQNPVTGEVYKRNEVTDLGGLNYATADMATIAKFHPDNADNHPEITDEMRAEFFQRNK
jgi:hypothetical protein